jgi:hypothetical protein
MQTTHTLDHLFAGTEMEVVRVAQNDLRTGLAHVIGTEAAHHRMGTHRHERGGLNVPVWQGENAGAGPSVGALNPELEHQVGQVIRPRPSTECGRSAGDAPDRGLP